MEFAFALFAVIAPLCLNLLATRAVLRDAFAERSQKLAQLLLVWLVPIIGAILVLAFHRRSESPSRKYREAPDPGDDYATSGRTVKIIREVADGDD